MGLIDHNIVFGIDGGGSRCRVAVCDGSGARIGEAVGGPSNFTSNREQALVNVREAIDKCVADCQISDACVKTSEYPF